MATSTNVVCACVEGSCVLFFESASMNDDGDSTMTVILHSDITTAEDTHPC